MSNLSGGVFIGLWIFYAIVCMILYWKSIVLIFDFGGALAQSIIFTIFASMLMTFGTLYFWKAAIVIVIIAGIILAAKAASTGGKTAAIIFAVILAVVIGVVGSSTKKEFVKADTQSYSIYTAL